ncbi:MAG: hypothetical protein HY720_17090 [Planctomycetes bacterium]|nr:hypothetical protein [Planctomycetota bacterium]
MASLIIGLCVAFFFVSTVAILGFGLKNIEEERANQARYDENHVRTSRFFSILSQDGQAIRVRAVDEALVRRVQEHLREEKEAAAEFVTNPTVEKLHRPTQQFRRRAVGY